MQIIRKPQKSLLARLGSSLASLLLLATLAAPGAGALTIGGPSDCDSNAVIRCGAHSVTALRNAYNGDVYVRKVYEAFGITHADMANLASTAVAGRVTRSGDVFIDSRARAVATHAITGGRQNMPGSTRVNRSGAVFFERPPSVSFQQASLPAFVSMSGGQFQFAVIASCGNAVKATPVAAPKPKPAPAAPVKPTPTPPAPTQTQTQTQTQINNQQVIVKQTQTPAPTPAAPVATAQPQNLVNTGAGTAAGLTGLFSLSAMAGVLGYRRWLTHRLDS